MRELINNCVKKIASESTIHGREGYSVQQPQYPSIIVNYNLRSEDAEIYFDYLEQLWPSVYRNIPNTGIDDDFGRIENEVRSNNIFCRFNEIHIHILVDIKSCDVNDVIGFFEQNFSGATYQLILHGFLDYEVKEEEENIKEKLIETMKHSDVIKFFFIYSNRLSNGGMWIGESESKLLRLAANITAITSVDFSFFAYGNLYTYAFSYDLLEKPARKIVLFTIYRLLENICSYSEFESNDLKKKIAHKYKRIINEEVKNKTKKLLFTEKDFEYVPFNHEIKKERKDALKSLETLEDSYKITALCCKALINRKIDKISSVSISNIDFTDSFEDGLLSYYKINSFLKIKNNKKEDLLNDMESYFTQNNYCAQNGNYITVLTEYANEKIESEIEQKVLSLFKLQFNEKINTACKIIEILNDLKNSNELCITHDNDIVRYYGGIVDSFWASNKDKIIEKLDRCGVQEDLLRASLFEILKDLFDRNPIYYESFENEVDQRVGNNTAENMFREIYNNNTELICINWSSLQFDLDISEVNSTVLLINPNSNLKSQIPDSYKYFDLSGQDCVERIGIYSLTLKNQ